MHLLHRIYEDTKSQRLEIYCDRRTDDFTVYARHSSAGRGASVVRTNEKDAKQVFQRLCNAAQQEGWEDSIRKCVSRGFVGGPARMDVIDGERFFQDLWTGARIFDESSWRPMTIPGMPVAIRPVEGQLTVFVCRKTDSGQDAFSLSNMPVPEE